MEIVSWTKLSHDISSDCRCVGNNLSLLPTCMKGKLIVMKAQISFHSVTVKKCAYACLCISCLCISFVGSTVDSSSS